MRPITAPGTTGRLRNLSVNKRPAISSAIGVGNLGNQRHKIVSKKGVEFTIMVVGESGLGKSTFINNLISIPVIKRTDNESRFDPEAGKTLSIKVYREVLEEKGFTVRLNVIDTPGFNCFVNNENCFMEISKMIDERFEAYLHADAKADRLAYKDKRVHACLYFIPPHGNIREIDIQTMKHLSTKVNLIPVIGKADLLTKPELAIFKKVILDALHENDVKYFTIPLESDDEESRKNNKSILDAIPFAVIASELDIITRDGHKIKGRQYPWYQLDFHILLINRGYIEVENDEHCDFKKLRNLLIRTHMDDLIQQTNDVHFENYRSQYSGVIPTGSSNTLAATPDKEAMLKSMKDAKENIKKKFIDLMKQEETRFRAWEERLKSEKDRYNKLLEQDFLAIKTLRAEVDALMKQQIK